MPFPMAAGVRVIQDLYHMLEQWAAGHGSHKTDSRLLEASRQDSRKRRHTVCADKKSIKRRHRSHIYRQKLKRPREKITNHNSSFRLSTSRTRKEILGESENIRCSNSYGALELHIQTREVRARTALIHKLKVFLYCKARPVRALFL